MKNKYFILIILISIFTSGCTSLVTSHMSDNEKLKMKNTTINEYSLRSYSNKFDNITEITTFYGFGTLSPSKYLSVKLSVSEHLNPKFLSIVASVSNFNGISIGSSSRVSNITNLTFINERLGLRVVLEDDVNVQVVDNSSSNYIVDSLSKEEALNLITILENKDSIANFNRNNIYYNTQYYNKYDQAESLKDLRSYIKQDGKRINPARQKQKQLELDKHLIKYNLK